MRIRNSTQGRTLSEDITCATPRLQNVTSSLLNLIITWRLLVSYVFQPPYMHGKDLQCPSYRNLKPVVVVEMIQINAYTDN
jgi:hypothetical protein